MAWGIATSAVMTTPPDQCKWMYGRKGTVARAQKIPPIVKLLLMRMPLHQQLRHKKQNPICLDVCHVDLAREIISAPESYELMVF